MHEYSTLHYLTAYVARGSGSCISVEKHVAVFVKVLLCVEVLVKCEVKFLLFRSFEAGGGACYCSAGSLD